MAASALRALLHPAVPQISFFVIHCLQIRRVYCIYGRRVSMLSTNSIRTIPSSYILLFRYSTHKLHSWSFTSLSQSGSLQVVGSNENGQLGLGDSKYRLKDVFLVYLENTCFFQLDYFLDHQ